MRPRTTGSPVGFRRRASGRIRLRQTWQYPATASASAAAAAKPRDGVLRRDDRGDGHMDFGGERLARRADADNHRRMSVQCREHAFTNWGWEGLASRLISYCESLST